MPVRRILCILTLALAGACGTPPPPPQLEARDAEARTTAVRHGDTLLFEVWSAKGIGSAKIEAPVPKSVRHLRWRLHLKGLESFRFTVADTTIVISVPTHDPSQIAEEKRIAGIGTRIVARSADWMTVRRAGAAKSTADWFDLEAPRSYMHSARGPFHIEWVDFYR